MLSNTISRIQFNLKSKTISPIQVLAGSDVNKLVFQIIYWLMESDQ